jgi:hypothetical protein
VSVSAVNLGNAKATSVGAITIVSAEPVLSHVRESHSVWARSRKLATISSRRRVPIGTTFAMMLNESATLRFAFAKLVSGRRVGRRCEPRTNANRKHRGCLLNRSSGTLRLAGHEGINSVAFYGQLARSRRLGTGTFQVSITAARSDGKASSPRVLRFSIVR